MKPLGDTDLKRLHREWRRRTEGRLAVLLDDLQTPFNVGAVVRTAAAERVEHLYLCGASALPTNAKAQKMSMGSERYLTWTACETAPAAVAAVHAAGYRLVGVELAANAVPLHEARLGDDICLALGHEDRGLSPTVLAACDEIVFIPQLGRVGSLNVAHAGAIAIYETRRRAWTS
ncbi:MAG: TrmH family RNA methyltransferase [Acidobacteria bacterium]|nr:TrmH family RNA methyltransferase [Acidobacteriota bacterium]